MRARDAGMPSLHAMQVLRGCMWGVRDEEQALLAGVGGRRLVLRRRLWLLLIMMAPAGRQGCSCLLGQDGVGRGLWCAVRQPGGQAGNMRTGW